ncbi:MAG: hypothetical protein R6V49_03435 [Bacteroidales bacterium]
MKRIVSLAILAMMIGATQVLFAQQPQKRQTEKETRVQEEKQAPLRSGGENAPSREQVKGEKAPEIAIPSEGKQDPKVKGKDKEHPGKGHAYGKDKEGLEGKEFGQARAAEARSKEKVLKETETNIEKAEKSNAATREKIKKSRENLEMKKNRKEISKEEYDKKKKELDEIEEKVEKLEKDTRANREKLEKENAEVK